MISSRLSCSLQASPAFKLNEFNQHENERAGGLFHKECKKKKTLAKTRFGMIASHIQSEKNLSQYIRLILLLRIRILRQSRDRDNFMVNMKTP